MKRITTLVALLLCISMASDAKVKMSNVCSDGMVLQQKSEVKVWGTADPKEKITVTPSWNGTEYKTKAGADGRWKVVIATPEASYTQYTISVTGEGNAITVNDVLIGEVWLASGQSNMEMPMKGFANCPVENSIEYISGPRATNKIRMFTVPKVQSFEPEYEVEGKWVGAESSTIPDMSATAYFFARKLNESLDVPVGILSSSYGGARLECWTPKEILETYNTEDLSREAVEALGDYTRPYVMYNAMLHPLIGYGINGFIWYQGCSNIGHEDQFVERMNNLILHWREVWGDKEGKLPFYMVEIAPYRYKPAQDIASPLRLAQHEAATAIPNCGIVVTNDLVDTFEQDNIHPMRKKEVGDRLAYLALNRNYGFTGLACESPEAVRCTMQSNMNAVSVELTNCANGINRTAEIKGLEVSGGDGIFYPVEKASFWNGSLMIRCSDVMFPAEVRYGWGDFNPGNLKNVEGLPVSPFWLKVERPERPTFNR